MEKLIELVKRFPELYDTTHEDYMRAKLKDDLWERIAKELNYTDGQAAKEQWRKLRECHREALRRQQKKNGQHIRLWTYQKQMEFLKPFMKHRSTVENPTSPPEESPLEEDCITPSDVHGVETTNDREPPERYDHVPPKRFKKSSIITDPVMRESDNRPEIRDDLSQNFFAEMLKQQEPQNDALYQFFMSMYNITKELPKKLQKEVRRKLFTAVSDAEDKAEDEIEVKFEVEENNIMY